MPEEQKTISVGYIGSRETLEGGLQEDSERELLRLTGLVPKDLTSFADLRDYTVLLHPILGEGEPYKGTGATLDEAIASASKEGSLEYIAGRVEVSAKRTAQVPFFTHTLHIRAKSERRLKLRQEEVIEALRTTYANRLDSQPHAVTFKAYRTETNYENDGDIPDGEILGVKAIGSSHRAMEEAKRLMNEQIENKKKKIETYPIFERELTVRIYGTEEEEVETTPRQQTKAAAAAETSERRERSGYRASTPMTVQPQFSHDEAVLV